MIIRLTVAQKFIICQGEESNERQIARNSFRDKTSSQAGKESY